MHKPLLPPPAALLEGASLFLDFDGTLVDLVDRPDEVVADPALRDLLTRLDAKLEGRLAVVSGRSLAQLDSILGPIAQTLALSGSHGSEHRWKGISAQPARPEALDRAAERLRPFAERNPGVLVEEKSYGVALHYRMLPEVEPEALSLTGALGEEFALHVQNGKMMVELRVPGGDKGIAVRRLMQRDPMKGTRPVFIGDDLTDESAFSAAVALSGTGILVGEQRETAARYGLETPAAVRAWLEATIA